MSARSQSPLLDDPEPSDRPADLAVAIDWGRPVRFVWQPPRSGRAQFWWLDRAGSPWRWW